MENQEALGLGIEALRINKKRLELIKNARSKMEEYEKDSEMGRYLTNFVIALEECEVK